MDIVVPSFGLDEEFDAVITPDLAVACLGVRNDFGHLWFMADDVENKSGWGAVDGGGCCGGRHGIACDGGQGTQ